MKDEKRRKSFQMGPGLSPSDLGSGVGIGLLSTLGGEGRLPTSTSWVPPKCSQAECTGH